jgi:hypothetical protein
MLVTTNISLIIDKRQKYVLILYKWINWLNEKVKTEIENPLHVCVDVENIFFYKSNLSNIRGPIYSQCP